MEINVDFTCTWLMKTCYHKYNKGKLSIHCIHFQTGTVYVSYILNYKVISLLVGGRNAHLNKQV